MPDTPGVVRRQSTDGRTCLDHDWPQDARACRTLQRELAEHGFSLRAAGTDSDLGFLAGSIENPDQFKS